MDSGERVGENIYYSWSSDPSAKPNGRLFSAFLFPVLGKMSLGYMQAETLLQYTNRHNQTQ